MRRRPPPDAFANGISQSQQIERKLRGLPATCTQADGLPAIALIARSSSSAIAHSEAARRGSVDHTIDTAEAPAISGSGNSARIDPSGKNHWQRYRDARLLQSDWRPRRAADKHDTWRTDGRVAQTRLHAVGDDNHAPAAAGCGPPVRAVSAVDANIAAVVQIHALAAHQQRPA